MSQVVTRFRSVFFESPWPIGSRPLALSCSPKMHLDGTSDGTPAVQRESNR